jgi:hypothetical protein
MEMLYILLITVTAMVVSLLMSASAFVVFSGGYHADEDDF